MWYKKNLFTLAVIINIIIAVFLSVNVRADDPAGDEQATFNISVPDTLLILDLSGSMSSNPAGNSTYKYGTTSCTKDTVACNPPTNLAYPYFAGDTCSPDDTPGVCHGSTDYTRIYAADANCTPSDTAGACRGTDDVVRKFAFNDSCTTQDVPGKCHAITGTYYYAHDSECILNNSTCVSPVTGSYIWGSSSSCVASASCKSPIDPGYIWGRSTSCTADTTNCKSRITSPFIYGRNSTCTSNTTNCKGAGCSGGFCSSSKTGCSYDCSSLITDCSGGFCADSQTGCSTNCSSRITDCDGGFCAASQAGCNVNCYTDCSGGFCATAKSGCDVNCSNSYLNCSGGFCERSKINCSTDCSYYNCVDGYCKYPKTACSTNCDCRDGACKNSKTGCTYNCGTTDCKDGFCSNKFQTDCNTNCTKLTIAKRALFKILDDDKDNTISDNDSASLNVRFGFMRFKSGDDTDGAYASGNNLLVYPLSAILTDGTASVKGIPYQTTYCGKTATTDKCITSTASCPVDDANYIELGRDASNNCIRTSDDCTTGECVAGENATGGTPLTSSLKEAVTYLNYHKSKDPSKLCRQKFVIVISDGADTYTCGGNGQECQEHMYKRRRAAVAATKQLKDAGYRVFVIGFGSDMPDYLKNTLNWMAYYGDTSTSGAKSGNTSAYNINKTAVCNLSTASANCFPSGVTSCTADASTITNADCGSSTTAFRATNNDPGYLSLSGYAFIAGNADELTKGLKEAVDTIRNATYSFTQVSIQASRTMLENYLYEAAFEPINNDPFWVGHLKRYRICGTADPNCAAGALAGSINGSSDWDAGLILKNTAGSARNIYTLNSGGSLTAFQTDNLTNTILNVASDTDRQNVVKFVRQGELDSSYEKFGWKLGDILHSVPLLIATPNSNFFDINDTGDPKAYQTYLQNHVRTSLNGAQIVLIGANDGQLHAFKTGEASADGGKEAWSFIPPNLLPKLRNFTHPTHASADITGSHGYFVDGLSTAAEVWLGTGTIGSTAKSEGDWKTYLVSSLGRGGISTLWSKYSYCVCPTGTADCSTAFSPSYSSTYKYYCGYYAFDISQTTSTPVFKWVLGGTSGLSATHGDYLGQPWSKMFFGRVRLNNTEKWVGLMGGGCAGADCSSTAPGDKHGKGFFVVDLSTGNILWKYTYADNSRMAYNIPAAPYGVDYDMDGFMDTVYLGDVGGNMWRFKFCLASEDTTSSPCTYSKWSASLLLNNH
jgi:hypothetical protein